MAERSITSDGGHQLLQSASERATGRKTDVETKPDEQVEKFEIVDDFEDTLSAGTARSRPWSIQGMSLQSAKTATPLRILDEFGMIDIPRSHRSS